MNRIRFIFLFIAIILVQSTCWSCTIFCAKDHHGHVWAGNNEDYNYFTFDTKVKITPKTDSTFGHIYFTYTHNIFPQGGVNEAGLFYDFNAVGVSVIKDVDKKVPFPGQYGFEIIIYMLEHYKTVPEVIELFEKYKMPWMNKAQMNVVDKFGNMGIIVADSAWITKENYQVSTNYNLSHINKDNIKCWRYPIAKSRLISSEANFDSFSKICESTSQRENASTNYSNVHNLNTGEMRIYYGWNYIAPFETTINDMMQYGDTLIPIRDLFPDNTLVKVYYTYVNEGFDRAVNELDKVKDSLHREDLFKLLSLDMLFGSTKHLTNNETVHRIIEVSNNKEILSILSKKSTLKANRKYAKQKLNTINNSGFRASFFIWLFSLGLVITLIIIFKKSKNKKQLTKPKLH